jgi:1-acyl-sn-glycerol-3-phosphate acyltransferase
MLWVAGTPVRVLGLEHVPAGTPVIYASNHQSWFDIWALAANLPGQVRFVSKRELARVPVLGPAMRSAGHIFLDRSNRQAAFAAYEEAGATIRSGMSAVVFPEGTRSRTGELQPFKKGPFVFGIAAQVPLVPVYCAGTFDILPKGKIRINTHPITIFVGPPIETAGLIYEDRERLMADAQRAVEALRDQALRAPAPAG